MQQYYTQIEQQQTHYNSAGRLHSEEPEKLMKQSSSTWRHSRISYSFCKGDRFSQTNKITKQQRSTSNNVESHLINIPHTRSTQACSFGLGQKQYMTNEEIKRAKVNPAPGHTNKINNMLKIRGISMGQKCELIIRSNTPPIGSYEIASRPGSGKREFKFQGKGKSFSDLLSNDNPASNHYNPQNFLVESSRFSRITFGKGKKYDFMNKKVNLFIDQDIPGPGMYNIKSVFDKFQKKQQKKIKKNYKFLSKQSLREAQQRLNESLINIEKTCFQQEINDI